MEVKLAILGEDKDLLGFKSDSFWTISEKMWKGHVMNENNQIDPQLLHNLTYLLNSSGPDDSPRETWLNNTILFIEARPVDGSNPVLLYKIRKFYGKLNGKECPWIVDVNLEDKILSINEKGELI